MNVLKLIFAIIGLSFLAISGVLNLNDESVDLDISDYSYLTNIGDIQPTQLGIFGNLSRSKTPKYTIIFMHGFIVDSEVLYSLTSKFYVRLVRHLDHYDQLFSNNVQLIAPNWHEKFLPFTREMSEGTLASFKAGRPDSRQFLTQTVSIIAFINSLIRKGVIPSLENTAIQGNCLGGIIGIAASLGMKSHLGAVSICSSALFHPDLIRRKILRKSSLNTSFLIIQGNSDQLIHPKFASITEQILRVWGAKSVILHKARGSHFPVMVQHLYTGFRFIASVLLKRPELFRLEDSYNLELIAMTKKKVENITEIVPIVPQGLNATNGIST